MNSRDYNAELYDKMKAEQDYYRNWLLSQSPNEILNHTYEYTVRENIVMAMEDLDLPPEKAKSLLKSKCPLADVYKEYSKQETDYMNDIRTSIEARATDVYKREKTKERNEAR